LVVPHSAAASAARTYTQQASSSPAQTAAADTGEMFADWLPRGDLAVA
jgi:hypothetical protein